VAFFSKKTPNSSRVSIQVLHSFYSKKSQQKFPLFKTKPAIIQAKMDTSSMSSNMAGMTMTDSMPSSTISAALGNSTGGMDMSNDTDPRMDLLMAILDDTELQVISNSYARRYWYGVVVVLSLAALVNIVVRLKSRSRYV
jgi:hypothetical protein